MVIPITLLGKRTTDHLYVAVAMLLALPSARGTPSFDTTTITNKSTVLQVVRRTQAKSNYGSPSSTTTRPRK